MAIDRRQRRSRSVRGVPVRVPVRAIHDLPVAAVRQRAVRVPVRVPVLLGSGRFGILLAARGRAAARDVAPERCRLNRAARHYVSTDRVVGILSQGIRCRTDTDTQH